MGVPVVEVYYVYSPFLAACSNLIVIVVISKMIRKYLNTIVCDRFLENTTVILVERALIKMLVLFGGTTKIR